MYTPQLVSGFFESRMRMANPEKGRLLCYLADGWSLAIHKYPLFRGFWIASDGRPVLEEWGGAKEDSLCEKDIALLDRIWQRYGAMSFIELRLMICSPSTPWANTYFGQGRGARIPDTSLAEYWTRVALLGRSKQGETNEQD